MSNPVYDQVAAVVKGWPAAERALMHVWREHQNLAQPYHSGSNPKETPVSAADTLRTDLESLIAQAEQDAAKVQRYESEPLVEGLLGLLESVPQARAIIEPAISGLSALAASASAPAAPPADPQIQTGIAQ